MKHFVVYDNVGRILRSGYCKGSDFDRVISDGEFIMEGIANGNIHYVNEGVIIDRPLMVPVVNKTTVIENEEINITNIPIGTTVIVGKDMAVVNDGNLVLTFDTSGKYKIMLKCFPYVDWEVTIICA